jgi:hypothetical protein
MSVVDLEENNASANLKGWIKDLLGNHIRQLNSLSKRGEVKVVILIL